MASVVNQPARYDAVIIGGRHNGLVAACYLGGRRPQNARARTLSEVGGAAISEETFPAYKISTGSYVLSLAPRKIFDELGAWSEGIELIERNPRFFAPFPDGQLADLLARPRQMDRTASAEAHCERCRGRGITMISLNAPAG